MTENGKWQRLRVFLREELRQLTTVRQSDRPWLMPFAAALCSGVPLLVGAYFGRMDYGLISSLGGLVFLYMPETPLYHRMVSLMACAFAMIASYAFGVISNLLPPVMMLALTFTSILVTMVCRFYRVGIPGSLFFIMAASIGAYSPGDILQVPLKVGLIAMGCLLACLIAFAYSIYMLRRRKPVKVEPLPAASFDFVVFDSVIIGAFVGISLAVAQLLQLENAYWVPVSCLAVIQGMSLRAVWEKQVHRVIGTVIGLFVSWGILSLPLDEWRLGFIIIALVFVIESAVVRHYGFAAIFITPLTLLLAEAPTLGQVSHGALIQARFFDTIIGCLTGFAGGICLHSPGFRRVVGRQMRRLIPGGLFGPG
ncbi:MAG: FUSC family protein [Dechloromonas sp.]|nr:FUSC family protein [Dechloromonas sp.]